MPDPAPPRAESRLFPDSGIAVMAAQNLHVLADAGPFGSSTAGHSHSDTLSIVARSDAHEILVDPGTFTYIADPTARDWFRGSAAHNTIRIGQRDQASPSGPFRWEDTPETRVLEWVSSDASDFLDAFCRYRGFCHRRRVFFLKPDLLFVIDDVEGPAGEHLVEQFWHFAAPAHEISARCFAAGAARLVLAGASGVEFCRGGEHGWRSRCLGVREPSPVLRVSRKSTLPVRFAALLDVAGCNEPNLQFVKDSAGIELRFASLRHGRLRFPDHGAPEYETDTAQDAIRDTLDYKP
jgi:hypothetical protein